MFFAVYRAPRGFERRKQSSNPYKAKSAQREGEKGGDQGFTAPAKSYKVKSAPGGWGKGGNRGFTAQNPL